MKIAVTGATGFIGQNLIRHIRSLGWEAVGLARRDSPGSNIHFDLRGDLAEGAVRGCDVLVHAAHAMSFGEGNESDVLNIEGSKRLFESFRKEGVRKIVYISSLSAHESVRSRYGSSKRAVESLLDLEKDCILRPGMVLGPGGFVERTKSLLRQSRFVPLPDGGSQPVYVIHVDDFCRVVEAVVRGDLKGAFHIGHPKELTVSRVYRSLAQGIRKRPIFVPMPMSLLFPLVRLAEWPGFRLPVSSENLLGLRGARQYPVGYDMNRIGVSVRSFDELAETGYFDEPGEPRVESKPPLLLRLIRPAQDEIVAYAREEADPRNVERFQPITRGPWWGGLVVTGVLLACAIVVPVRVLAALFGRSRVD